MNKKDIIISSSGWRAIFHPKLTLSEQKQVQTIAWSFVLFSDLLFPHHRQKIALGTDTRVHSQAIATVTSKVFQWAHWSVDDLHVSPTPEIISYAQKEHISFCCITASHNPPQYNGFKWGLHNGHGVINTEQTEKMHQIWDNLHMHWSDHYQLWIPLSCSFCSFLTKSQNQHLQDSLENFNRSGFSFSLDWSIENKKSLSLAHYEQQIKQHIPSDNVETHSNVSDSSGFGIVVADFNGGSRYASIDRNYWLKNHIHFECIHDQPGEFAHSIVPEGKALEDITNYLSQVAQREKNQFHFLLGYVCDCDGDRGNILYWDKKLEKVICLDPQKGVALCFLIYLKQNVHPLHSLAFVVNDASSFMCYEIAQQFACSLGVSEVGEANVLAKASQLEKQGFHVPISAEGSNGGCIWANTYVRDPLMLMAHLSHYLQSEKIEISELMAELPEFLYTAVSDNPEACLKNVYIDSNFKKKYLELVGKNWIWLKNILSSYSLSNIQLQQYKQDTCYVSDQRQWMSLDQKTQKGLEQANSIKLVFYNGQTPFGFLWFRSSQTEPIVRFMVEIKGRDTQIYDNLFQKHREWLITCAKEQL